MRIFSAGIDSETNTFTNLPTTWESFREGGIWRGNAGEANIWISPVPATFARLARARGFEYVEGLYAAAEPSGRIVRTVYEVLRDEILQDARDKGPFDLILLHLHGASLADGYEDCAGDLLFRLRTIAGPSAVVGAILDPHCHLSPGMVTASDILVACKHFPHDDYAERAAELFDRCVQAAQRRAKPVAAVFDCKMTGIYPTTDEPMSAVVRALIEAECNPGILSVSFIHGMPWSDSIHAGSKMLVYADEDRTLAETYAERLGRMVYELRALLLPRYPPVEEALKEAEGVDGLVILADTADNPGGGAPGDNVSVLSTFLKEGITDAAMASIWDPQVAQVCAAAGVGSRLTIRLGGKTSGASGAPIDVNARVCAVSRNHFQTSIGATRQDMGLSVWIMVEGIDVVVSSVRAQAYSPDVFTGLGIDIRSRKLGVVKSTNHFYSRFAPLAGRIIRMATPGALSMDFANIEYERRSLDFFPRVSHPLAHVGAA